MSIISASVGAGGANRPRDVRIIEFLLSRLLGEIYPERAVAPDGTVILAMGVDGVMNVETIRVIEDFQRRLCGMQRPDGRIDPNRKTIANLIGLFLKSRGGVALITLQEVMRRRAPPLPFPRPAAAAIFQGGVLQAGQTVAGFDGRRLLISITAIETIFLLLDNAGPAVNRTDPIRGRVGALYHQDTLAFLDERDSAFLLDLSQRLESGYSADSGFSTQHGSGCAVAN